MRAFRRYARVWLATARYGLARELMFRTNFLVKAGVELLWLAVLLVSYDVVLTHTGAAVAGWTRAEYLFFVGCYFALEGCVETLFLGNCGAFAELVRTGDLDLLLLKPVDTQFLVSLRGVEWTTAPNVLAGAGVMAYALVLQQWAFDAALLGLFGVLFACALVTAYSLLVTLTALAVWTVRNQSVVELWWLFTTLWRNPREIFDRGWATWVGRVFTYVVPATLIVQVPVEIVVRRTTDPYLACYLMLSAGVLFWSSRRSFQSALRYYRSASS